MYDFLVFKRIIIICKNFDKNLHKEMKKIYEKIFIHFFVIPQRFFDIIQNFHFQMVITEEKKIVQRGIIHTPKKISGAGSASEERYFGT